jgi:hypothetical protein
MRHKSSSPWHFFAAAFQQLSGHFDAPQTVRIIDCRLQPLGADDQKETIRQINKPASSA